MAVFDACRDNPFARPGGRSVGTARGFVRSDQVRGVRFEGELMALSPPPRTSGGREEYRELTWQRISAE